MKRIIFSVFFVLSGVILYSETRTLTLSNAVELALQNHPQISEMEADVKAARAQYEQALADFWLPDVTASAGMTFLDYDSYTNSIYDSMRIDSNMTINLGTKTLTLPATTVIKITNAYQDNYNTGISISKPLFTGFKLMNAVELKKLALGSAEKKLADKKREVEINTEISFLQILMINETLSLQESLSSHIRERLDNTIERFKAGTVSEYDSIRAEIQYENSLPALDRLRDNFSNASFAFKKTLGLTDDVIFTGDLKRESSGLSVMDESNAFVMAVSNDVNLSLLDIQAQSVLLSRKIAAGSRYPTLAGFFNYNYDYKKPNMLSGRSWVGSWNTGLQLSIGLDEWLPISRTQKTMDEADAGMEKLAQLRREYLDGLSVQIKSLTLQQKDADVIILRQSATAKKADRAFFIAQERYRTGAAPLQEVTEAETLLVQTKSTVIQAYFDRANAILKLERLAGNR